MACRSRAKQLPVDHGPAQLVDAQRTHGCAQWDRAVPRWLRRHPSIRTVITSNDARATFERPARGGYRDEWREAARCDPGLTHVVVIRDTPQINRPQADCVTRALAPTCRRACAAPSHATKA